MAETLQSGEPSGWRIPKACQECRKRKIKCNGVNPCKTCRVRNTPCVYRDVIRQRKKKKHGVVDEGLASRESTRPELGTQQPSSPLPQPVGRRNKSASYTFHNSVSATHMASPSCKVQLYYGPTSHFTLMHEIYRGLVSNQTTHPEEPQGEVEEAGAGLDMFSVRGIFFGTPAETHDPNKGIDTTVAPVMFLPYELARIFLQRFLSTLYHLVPFWSKELYERQLEHLYLPSSGTGSDACANSILLMALAMGSLGTQHYRWGDILFERVKASCPSWDDVVNLEIVQLSLMMISIFRPLRCKLMPDAWLARSFSNGARSPKFFLSLPGHSCEEGHFSWLAQGIAD